jgi:hypothetical protein
MTTVVRVQHVANRQYPCVVSAYKNGQTIIDSDHRLKQAAEKAGRRLAKDNRPSKLEILNLDGNISYTQRYER